MKTQLGVGVELHTFLSSVLDGGEWLASRHGRLISESRAPGTHWIGDWVGPRSGLDAVVKNPINFPAGNSTPAVQPIA